MITIYNPYNHDSDKDSDSDSDNDNDDDEYPIIWQHFKLQTKVTQESQLAAGYLGFTDNFALPTCHL